MLCSLLCYACTHPRHAQATIWFAPGPLFKRITIEWRRVCLLHIHTVYNLHKTNGPAAPVTEMWSIWPLSILVLVHVRTCKLTGNRDQTESTMSNGWRGIYIRWLWRGERWPLLKNTSTSTMDSMYVKQENQKSFPLKGTMSRDFLLFVKKNFSWAHVNRGKKQGSHDTVP